MTYMKARPETYTVACSFCGASAGNACRSKTNPGKWLGTHQARVTRWLQIGTHSRDERYHTFRLQVERNGWSKATRQRFDVLFPEPAGTPHIGEE